MPKELTIVERIDSIENMRASLLQLGELEPEKAYLIGNTLAKLGKDVQDEFKPGFQKYCDLQGELPAGFKFSVVMTTKYCFEENAEWADLKAKMDSIEDKIKTACQMSDKGGVYVEDSGEIIDPVTRKFTEAYKVTRK